jgi:recombination protein RecT
MRTDWDSIEGPGIRQVRTSERLRAFSPPVQARPAATVLLLRDRPTGGFEILMTRRSLRASFAPGAYVFPGGALDSSDRDAIAAGVAQTRSTQDSDLAAYGYAAVREAFEELGVLLARDSQGHWATEEQIEAMDRNPDASFTDQLKQHGLIAAVDSVYWLAHWITDRDLPKRFDVQFLVAAMPPGQTPLADETEQFEPVWITAQEALDRHARGLFDIIFPTIRTLRRLAKFETARSVLNACRDDRPLWTSCPRAGMLGGETERYSEEELPFGELELVAPDGQLGHQLDWQHQAPVALTRRVLRWTAPNPGMMTGPGTNTYLIGDSDGWIVIDPGPDNRQHIERLAGYVGKALKAILCTHAHPDHSPGAFLLQQACPAPIYGMGWDHPTYGKFTPDITLADGQSVSLPGLTVRAVHTPGHASNHLCFFLEEDRLLFSGDHINSGSTVVINPPDGNMLAYIEALDRLATLESSYILPAHGWVIGFPSLAITQLKNHRLAREAKVLQALQAEPQNLDALLPSAYSDVKPALYPVAARSLLAHLEKLQSDGKAKRYPNGWARASSLD